jgi:hypothetical protein
MLEELAVNGSGAATFDSFYRIKDDNKGWVKRKRVKAHTFSHFLQTMVAVGGKAMGASQCFVAALASPQQEPRGVAVMELVSDRQSPPPKSEFQSRAMIAYHSKPVETMASSRKAPLLSCFVSPQWQSPVLVQSSQIHLLRERQLKARHQAPYC